MSSIYRSLICHVHHYCNYREICLFIIAEFYISWGEGLCKVFYFRKWDFNPKSQLAVILVFTHKLLISYKTLKANCIKIFHNITLSDTFLPCNFVLIIRMNELWTEKSKKFCLRLIKREVRIQFLCWLFVPCRLRSPWDRSLCIIPKLILYTNTQNSSNGWTKSRKLYGRGFCSKLPITLLIG